MARDPDPVYCSKNTEMWDPVLGGVRSTSTKVNGVDAGVRRAGHVLHVCPLLLI